MLVNTQLKDMIVQVQGQGSLHVVGISGCGQHNLFVHCESLVLPAQRPLHSMLPPALQPLIWSLCSCRHQDQLDRLGQ